ncbi:ECF RNA polymerase sigma factor SigE [Gemmata sp. SH-PL17]|uniref:sigma-70 family RNA polymerase sigma factor n=1 Tax=Gemmata sp. SH-PL17 TaxID=1630693 RepID=UPI00078E6DD2|nr:sigma-70 family RNA polymerase sigma factor [Gemmata sp. SH-PL17]AMV24306.1 ECF RNA polymerase sigma factor SigE [Gemmata sp. SH-PL17]
MSQIEFRQAAVRLLRADLQPPQLTDAELLARFAATRDECAFAELVARHSALVRGTVRRRVRDPHTVEDVCQATFLVLAGKAATVQWGRTVGPWLHATAVRLARKALRRTRANVPAVSGDVPSSAGDPAVAVAWDEVCRALDDELAALPDALRGPLVLCYLQGRTRDEAAHALGCSLAMLKRRLERGRNLLRDRLARRGITLPAAGFGVLATDLTGTAAVDSTTRAAVAFVSHGTASPAVAALVSASRGFQLKVRTLVAVVVGLVACGWAFAALITPASAEVEMPSDPPAVALASDEPPRADAPGDPLPPAALARLGSTRLRAGGRVERMAFSPDGTQLASWSGDSHTNDSLTIWDAKTGRALRRVDLPGARVDQLVWLADGRGIALVRGSYDDRVPLIWEFTDEKGAKPQLASREMKMGIVPVNPNPQDNERDSCYAINPDGKTLAIGRAGQLDRAREVRLCELKTGVKVDALKPLRAVAVHPASCGEVHFTPDTKTLVVLTRAKQLGRDKFESEVLVSVWDVSTGDSKAQFKVATPFGNGIRTAVALSNTTLAIGLEKGDTSLWTLTTGKEQKLATGHENKKPGRGHGTYSVAFSPDGKTLATGGHDEVTKVWDVATSKLLHTLTGNHTWVEALAVTPDGKTLASAGQNGLIRLWDFATGADVCPQVGHKDAVSGVAFGSDGKTVVTGSRDGTVRWWDSTTGADRRSISVLGGIGGFSFNPDGKSVLVSTCDGKLRTWDAVTGRENTPTNLPGDAKFGPLSFTPDGKYLVASSGPNVAVWEWPGMKLARTIELPKPTRVAPKDPKIRCASECQVASVSTDGKWLVTVSYCACSREQDGRVFGSGSDGVVDLWDFATGQRVRRLVTSQGTYRSGGFTADGLFLLTGAGGTIQLADGRDGESFTGEINLIDPIAGRWVRGFDGPPVPKTVSFRYIGSSALAPDGRTLYVSYSTGEVAVFEVATGLLRRTLAGRQGYVPALNVSADGSRMLSGGSDGTAIVWDATLAGAAPKRGQPLTEADAEKRWEVISRSSPEAFTALCELAGAPDRAMPLLRKHMKPSPAAPSDAVLDRIFTDLGSGEPVTQKRATKELTEYGESAVPGVRKRLEGEPTAEARARALAFLKSFEKGTLSAARLRQLRVVELLEGLGTPAARKFLAELAAGAPGTPLTTDAAATLKRLGQP